MSIKIWNWMKIWTIRIVLKSSSKDWSGSNVTAEPEILFFSIWLKYFDFKLCD